MTPQLPPRPGYSALRKNRWSAPGTDYFVTLNVQRPASGLSAPGLRSLIDDQRTVLEMETHWNVRTSTIMPDHIHLLFTLGAETSLPECMRLFKGRLSPALRKHALAWQDGYYDHRLRPDEDRLLTFLYVFLNPYRAKLLSIGEKWPSYYCATDDWLWFGSLTNSDTPFPEWLR